ncbi:MAG: sensor histidine kinase [Pseudomonadota bacterium]
MRLAALIGGLVVAAALAWAGAGPAGANPSGAVLTLGQADALLEPEGAAPVERAALPLPHWWDKQFPGRGGKARYRLLLPAASGDEPIALLIEHVGNQAELRVNGQVVQRLGRLGDEQVDVGKASQLVVVPTAVLRGDAANRLEIVATIQPQRHGGLSAVRYGPPAALEPLQAGHRLRDQYASAAYAAGLLLMGGVAAGLWWRQRDPVYGCFSLVALSGSARHLDKVLPIVPLPWMLWGALLAAAYACQLGLTARFVVLLLGHGPPRLVRATHFTLAAAVLLAGLSFALRVPQLWTLGLALMLALGLWCFAVVLRDAMAHPWGMAWLVLAAGSLLLVAGAHDLLRVRMALFGGSGTQWAPHAMFFFVLILAGLVVLRYNRSVADYRALNDQLAERVAARERQLNEAFATMRQQREEQAVLNERQRIMREIHDGVGSQLVGLLNMVSREAPDPKAMQEQVTLALDEMRMAVDSLQPVHHDLTTVLATLRYRLQPRLQAAGIEVVWDVPLLPPLEQLTPQVVLQMQRILLEAFTNVLKHARATRVALHVSWQGGGQPGVALALCDNGVGMAAEPGPGADTAPRGHGLANMRTRAASIGAVLQVERCDTGGTCVRLHWPVPPPASA